VDRDLAGAEVVEGVVRVGRARVAEPLVAAMPMRASRARALPHVGDDPRVPSHVAEGAGRRSEGADNDGERARFHRHGGLIGPRSPSVTHARSWRLEYLRMATLRSRRRCRRGRAPTAASSCTAAASATGCAHRRSRARPRGLGGLLVLVAALHRATSPPSEADRGLGADGVVTERSGVGEHLPGATRERKADQNSVELEEGAERAAADERRATGA
jgi:hypothetical protein